MDATALLATRARGLDRLRSGSSSGASSRRAASGGRAHDLAAAVGGQVLSSLRGSVVAVEVAGPLPLQAERLAALPDPVAPRHPLVCLDLETTGLGSGAGTLAFLIGLGTWQGDRFSVRQLLLPDQAEEPALLDELAASISANAWLVTYNGRGFDWPLLVARYRLHRRDPPEIAGHLDLLPLARWIWRHRLADARLASVEAGVCGIRRLDDLPGALIPDRYFGYLRTGDGGLLSDVVRHNRQDIASLARLLRVLATGLHPERLGDEMEAPDVVGLGRAYLRRRRYESALACFDAVMTRVGAPAHAHDAAPLAWEAAMADRSRVLARLGRHGEAALGWEQVAVAGGHLAGHAWIRLAKHREHLSRDVASALSAACQADSVARRARERGAPLLWLERDLQRRLPRLQRKLGLLAAAQMSGAAPPTLLLAPRRGVLRRASEVTLHPSAPAPPSGWPREPPGRVA